LSRSAIQAPQECLEPKHIPMKDKHLKQTGSFEIDNKTEKSFEQQLEASRCRIDGIDRQIVSLLTERQKEVEQGVSLKSAHNIPVYHPAREENLVSDRRRQGFDAGLDADFIEELYRLILRNSRMEQVSKIGLAFTITLPQVVN